MSTKQTEALEMAQELRALAERFSEGWHDGIEIDASDIMLLSDAAEALAEQPAQTVRPEYFTEDMTINDYIWMTLQHAGFSLDNTTMRNVLLSVFEEGARWQRGQQQQQSCDSRTGESETQSDLKFAGETQAQQQEPVAWKDRTYGNLHHQDFGNSIPLYTSPQPSKPLTDEEIEAAMPSGIYDCLADPWDCGVGDGNEMRSVKKDVLRIARAIEAAHGIK